MTTSIYKNLKAIAEKHGLELPPSKVAFERGRAEQEEQVRQFIQTLRALKALGVALGTVEPSYKAAFEKVEKKSLKRLQDLLEAQDA